jgi:hypothetical protein
MKIWHVLLLGLAAGLLSYYQTDSLIISLAMGLMWIGVFGGSALEFSIKPSREDKMENFLRKPVVRCFVAGIVGASYFIGVHNERMFPGDRYWPMEGESWYWLAHFGLIFTGFFLPEILCWLMGSWRKYEPPESSSEKNSTPPTEVLVDGE